MASVPNTPKTNATPAANNIKHIVVLMMENRSFDHMLGGLKAENPLIEGLTGNETNPDPNGELVKVQPLAEFQGQIDPNPSTRFAAVQRQISVAEPSPMQGFVQSYFEQRRTVSRARRIMYYFSPEKLPVLSTLAREFAVFNAWFSSVPGPGKCNHDFAHFGSSWGKVDSTETLAKEPYLSIFDRMIGMGRTAKLYSFGDASPAKGSINLFKNPPAVLASHNQFYADCAAGTLPDYSFFEPNHRDHSGSDGEALVATDQHPNHNVQTGERLIASVYNAIRQNPSLWQSTALLIVYDEHGGFYDHVPPPSCPADNLFQASASETGTETPFAFDRLGVRVPAILISPWIARATVVPGNSSANEYYEHASIPASVAQLFLTPHSPRSPREMSARTFLNLFGSTLRADSDCPVFQLGDNAPASANASVGADNVVEVSTSSAPRVQELAGYQSDEPEGQDLLDITREVEALATVLAAKEASPPLSLGLFGDWGTGKSFFMRRLERRIRILQDDAQAAKGDSAFCESIVQITFNAWNYIDTSLWASLTSEIFEGLAAALARRRVGGDSQDQRARVLAAASSSQTVLTEAERRKTEAVEALRSNEQRLQALKSDQAAIEASLDPMEVFNAAYKFAVAQPQVQQYVKSASEALHVDKLEAAGEDVKSEILELRGIWSTIFFTIRNSEKLWIWLVAPPVALAAGWAMTALLQRFDLSGIMEHITAALTAAAAFLAWFLPGTRKALNYIQQARAAKEELINQKRRENIGVLETQQAEMAKKVEDAQRDVDQAAKAALEIDKQLQQLRADRRLADYIRQRNESTDYTKHLGLIARVRSDFKQLSTLLRDVQEEADSELKRRQNETGEGQKLFPRIDRIILYIDDLDRCPEKNVVEVLQAVNLLLAFPLFVVVVGVDPRWLVRSLERQSTALASGIEMHNGDIDLAWQSTPLNYLEKIFQIPFTLRPMDSRGFSRLVDTLSGAPAEPPKAGDVARTEPVVAQAAVSESTPTSDAVEIEPVPIAEAALSVNRKPEHLRIETWERTFMKRLNELIPSPRAGKRFINIYRLIRATVPDAELATFLGQAGGGGEHECALLLLAILTGRPAEACELLRELIETQPVETWWTFVDKLKAARLAASRTESDASLARNGDRTLPPDRWVELFDRLERIRPYLADQPCSVFTKWAPRIARYSFQSGRILFSTR